MKGYPRYIWVAVDAAYLFTDKYDIKLMSDNGGGQWSGMLYFVQNSLNILTAVSYILCVLVAKADYTNIFISFSNIGKSTDGSL